MNLWKRLVIARRRLPITTKFWLAFITLLLLIAIVALTGFASLNAVQIETKRAIDNGIYIQSLVFDMDAALRRTRQLEREFFLRWPIVGFSKASQEYVEKHQTEIANVLDISSRLQERIERSNAGSNIRRSTPDIEQYRVILQKYNDNFQQAVSLVNSLGIEDVGTLAKLEQASTKLGDMFQLVDAPDLTVLYLKMHSAEKEYLLTRQAASNRKSITDAAQLRKSILTSSKFNAIQRAELLNYLDVYESIAKEIFTLNEQIDSKILTNVATDTAEVSERLRRVVTSEVESARAAIDGKIKTAKVLLFLAVLLAWFVAILVAKQFISALRALAAEQLKSERLLLNILPEPIAQRLKREENTIADSFAEVTVMFADLVGFTELATQTPAIELVEILNVIFSEFDQLADAHGLEKIKTIGDAYMVVGGLPQEKPNHAEAIAAMALDMQACISEFCKQTGKALSIRIGINTGPVIAGIIGTKKFIYDLWGDTVNVASRMESHGLPDSIQVTEATYERLKLEYLFEERGPIQIKGRGQMNCYLLKGKKD
jgi:adenylate cyclase